MDHITYRFARYYHAKSLKTSIFIYSIVIVDP